jgi:hypothetical protein
MVKTQEQFIGYLEDKERVFDVGASGNGVVVLRSKKSGVARFDDAMEHGWYLSVWNQNEDYNLAVFMPIDQ